MLMNDKQNELYRIVDIVVSCCSTEVQEGKITMTREGVLGRSRNENLCMARAILVNQLIWAGYSVSTVSMLLGRSAPAIRSIKRKHDDYVDTSRAYRIALSEVIIKCRSVEPKGL